MLIYIKGLPVKNWNFFDTNKQMVLVADISGFIGHTIAAFFSVKGSQLATY